ncbi:MAG TPA: OmpH family outer membrane protein [Spirochaetota bacterium]|nr:OmpH family outer membrane protein [Spirochaetota bacterium]
MKKSVILAAVVLCILPAMLPAASLKDIIKIGVVDMGKLFSEYASKSEASKSVREKKARFVKEIRDEAAVIRKMESDLKDQMAGASDSERRRRIAEIEFKKDELASLVARRNAELEKEERDITQPILQEIYEAVRFVANKQGIKIVLDSRSYIAYHDIELDLTQQVILRLRMILSQKQRF